MVERAPLRPVPRRPGGPVEPDVAGRHVAARLPALDPAARDALALVTLAGRTRAEAAARLELAPSELAVALARGRKALRRSAGALAGSGWCERAETLISDRLDGALDGRGAARLDVHLRNCPRCVEHERLLVAAIDGLVESAVAREPGGRGEPGGRPEPAPADAQRAPLRLADARTARRPAPSLGRPPIASRPFGAPIAPARARPRAAPPPRPDPPAQTPPRPEPRPWPAQRIDPPVQPPGQPGPVQPPQQPPEQPPVEPPRPPGPEPPPPGEPPEQPIEPPARPAEPAQVRAAPGPGPGPGPVEQPSAPVDGPVEQPSAPGGVPVEGLPERVGAAAVEPIRRSRRGLAVALGWHVLFALAVLLAIAVVAITIWGATGGEL